MVMQKGDLSTALNARIIGTGKDTIILAHGYGGDQSVWDKVVPKLSESYQILLFDWCFSGAIKDQSSLFDAAKYCSDYEAFADDLIALADEMKLDSCIFVGHSMSGMIGCVASVKRPQLFKRLFLVGSSPRFINSENYDGGFELSDVEQMFQNIEKDYDVWSTSFASLVVDAQDPASVKKFDESLKRMGVKIGLPLAKAVFLSDHRSILDKVVTPCTIIQTKLDLAVPNSVATYMHNKIKGESTVEIINTQGHFPQLTGHDEFLDVFDRVLS